MMKHVIFNGKFYAGALNGVHRVADKLITAIDNLVHELPASARPKMSVIVPASARWQPNLSAIEVIRENGKCGQLWEQFTLPRRAKGQVLVNLCNLAPVVHRNKLLLIHDAQFLLPDSSYPFRQRMGYRLLVPWMARTSRRVMTVSNYSRQTLSIFGVAPLQDTRVLYNGVDHILDAKPRLPDGHPLPHRKFVILFGSEKSYKNNQVIFDAFRDGRMSGYTLVVVGPGRGELVRAGLKPPDTNTVFVGRIDDDHLRGLFDSALCLLFPSRTEGFGLPPAEAMICGCPVVVSPAGAIPEICRDAASYADVDASESWIDAIRRLDLDADYRARKVAAGLALMGRFTWRSAGEKLMQEIMSLASATGEGGPPTAANAGSEMLDDTYRGFAAE